MSAKKEQATHFEFYPVAAGDQFDIGFKIRGFEFRFINPRKQDRSQDRPWKQLTKEDLSSHAPAFLAELERRRPGFFGSDGLHRRMGENILAWCPSDIYAEAKKSLKQRNQEDMERIFSKQKLSRDLETQGTADSLDVDMTEQFKR